MNVPQADERNRVTDRKEVPLFNQKVYREAIVNAFVHNHWLDGPPAFTVFQDRIEILSRGLLPPKQTMDGFFAGESVPVNEKLARIILQLHISEQTGRGIPIIVEAYGRNSIRFSENNIKVTIPFSRLDNKVIWGSKDVKQILNISVTRSKNESTVTENTPVEAKNTPVEAENTPVEAKNTPVEIENTPVKAENTPVEAKNTPVKAENTPVEAENTPVNLSKKEIVNWILHYCSQPRSALEISKFLGYKEKKSVRKYIHRLVDEGRIAMTIPEKPHSRFQKYITIE